MNNNTFPKNDPEVNSLEYDNDGLEQDEPLIDSVTSVQQFPIEVTN